MDWELIATEAEFLQTECGMSAAQAEAEATWKWLLYIKCLKEGVPWQ